MHDLGLIHDALRHSDMQELARKLPSTRSHREKKQCEHLCINVDYSWTDVPRVRSANAG